MTDIKKLMDEAVLQNKESWITLYLNNGGEIMGQIVDYNINRVLIMKGEYCECEDVLVIPMNIIEYFACEESYFTLK